MKERNGLLHRGIGKPFQKGRILLISGSNADYTVMQKEFTSFSFDIWTPITGSHLEPNQGEGRVWLILTKDRRTTKGRGSQKENKVSRKISFGC